MHTQLHWQLPRNHGCDINYFNVGLSLGLSLSLGLGLGCLIVQAQDTPTPVIASSSDLPPTPKGFDIEYASEPVSLIPAQGQGSWDTIDFAGAGDIEFKSGTIVMEAGEALTGVYWDQDDFPKTNYELTMEVRRTRGIDFFCGPVFPVNDSHCCLIVAGWAGAVVGLSNIDDKDASSNETTMLMNFDDNRWYRIRVRVLPDQIIAWIDDQCMVNANIAGRKISLRGDTELCTPLGLCTFCTTSETRNFTMRKIQPKTQPQSPAKKSKK
jgi:hypothetical protein